MKTKNLVIGCTVIALMLMISSTGFAHGHWYHRHCCYSSSWWVPGAIVASGVLVGLAITRPWYTSPRAVYVYPQSTIVYVPDGTSRAVSKRAYASPDPQFVEKYRGSQRSYEIRSGEWVSVPGHQVNGKWVPPHKVWIPSNPVTE